MIVDALLAVLPADRVVVDPDVMASYQHDEAEWAPSATPLAVVRPATADEVQATVRACLDHGTAVVTRGAGTGLSGGANATAGCIVLALDRMTAITEIDHLERYAVVQPGVINDDLRAAVAEVGLWYPPDPASSPWSTIGGNVATNAGGLCCVKYGVTRDYVMGMEVVTGTGEKVRLGRRTAKGVAGYDLAGLMVGSEGTLGVITEITVKLRPLQDPQRTVAGYFDSIVDAGRAVAAVAAAGLTPSALELVDKQCLLAVDAWKNMGLSVDAEVVLLGRVDTPGRSVTRRLRKCSPASTRAAPPGRRCPPIRRRRTRSSRRGAWPTRPWNDWARCSPRTCASPNGMCRKCCRGSRRSASPTTSSSPTSPTPATATCTHCSSHPGDDAARARSQAAFAEIIDAALALGGTVTGEHGVGLLKMHGLVQELDPVVLAMHRAVKDALDPQGILNPGKVFDQLGSPV